MNRLTAALAFALCATAIASCSSQNQSTTSGGTEATATPAGAMTAAAPMMGSGAITVAINAQNGSGETGKALLTPMGARTKVMVSIKGEPKSGDQPAHIHAGTCAKLNPKPEYPLHDVIGGMSTTVVSVSLSTLTAKASAINVHQSAANIGKYVACGDIVKP